MVMSRGMIVTLFAALVGVVSVVGTDLPTNVALARIDFSSSSDVTMSSGRISSVNQGASIYRYYGDQHNWKWTQSYTTRRPTYVTADYVCWNAAHFQPAAENKVSQVLILQTSRRYEYSYWRMYRFARGLTVLIVAKWDGQQGNKNWQEMMARSADTTTSGSSPSVYGWMATMSEKGVVGIKGAYVYRYCWWGCRYNYYRVSTRHPFSDTTAPHLFRFQVDTSGYTRMMVDKPGVTGTIYRDNYELWNTYSYTYYLSYDENMYWSSYYGPLTIGGGAYYSQSSTQGAYGFNGKIYEALVFHNQIRSAPTATITQAENYLMEKYFLKCKPPGNLLSAAVQERIEDLSTACAADAADPLAGQACNIECKAMPGDDYKYAGSTAYLPKSTDAVATMTCNRGTWMQGDDFQFPDCAVPCPNLYPPANAGKCEYTRFTEDFDSIDFAIAPDYSGEWFYPRFSVVPGIPDIEMENVWFVDTGKLVGDVTTNVCGSTKVPSTTMLLSKYKHYSEGATRDHTFSLKVDVDKVLTGGWAGVYARWYDDKNYVYIHLIPQTSTQTIRVIKNGVEQTQYRSTFSCSILLDTEVKLTMEWVGTKLNAYCGSAKNPTSVVNGAGTVVPTGTFGVHVNAARVKFDEWLLMAECSEDGANCRKPDPGSICKYDCLDGWEKDSGDKERTCNWDGTWTGDDIACKRTPPDWTGATRVVPERSPVNTAVGDPLEASVGGGDQAVVWAITAGNDGGAFKIGSCDAQIRVASAILDYQTQSSYTLTVAARTDGDLNAETEATVVINIVDVNDPPIVADPKSFEVEENTDPGTEIGTLQYTDADDNDATWAIEFGNDLGVFGLDSETGELTVAKNVLNYEQQELYSLFVKVTDIPAVAGQDPGTGSSFIDINILDANDAPTFMNDTVLYINEINATKGTDIGVLPTSDEDGDGLNLVRVDEALLWKGPGGNFGTGSAAPDPDRIFINNPGESNALLDAGVAMLQFDKDLVYDQTPNEGDAEYPFTFRDVLVRAVYALKITIRDSFNAATSAWTFIAIEANIEAREDAIVTDIWVCGGSTSDPLESCLSQNFSSTGELISEQPISKTAMSTSGGDWIAIRGMNFVDTFEVSATYTSIGGDLEYIATDCQIVDEDPDSEDSTLAACKSVKGVGADLVWSVTMNRVVRLGPILRTSYETPKITGIEGEGSTDITELKTIGGQSIRLTGSNIGYNGMDATTVARLVRVTYGAEDEYEADVESVDETSVVVRTVEGYGTDHSWTVLVAGQAAEVDDDAVKVSYAPPTIADLRVPDDAEYMLNGLDTAGGQTIVVVGSNFGPYAVPGTDPEEPVMMQVTYGTKPAGVTFGDSPQENEYFTSVMCTKDRSTPHSQMLCTSKPGIGRDHAWVVTVGGQTSGPSSDKVSYLPPVISSIQGPGTIAADTAGGQTVYIRGQHFGPKSLNGVEWVRYGKPSLFEGVSPVGDEDPLFDAVACSVTNDPSDSSSMITCNTNEGRGRGHHWSLRIGGQDAVAVYPANSGYGQPILSSFSGAGAKDAITPGGETVIITGRNFGPKLDSLVTVKYSAEISVRDPETGATIGTEIHTFYPDMSECTMPMEYKHTRIICETAEGAGTALSWNVTVSGQDSRNPTTDYHVPEISSIAIYDGSTFDLDADVPAWSAVSALTPKTTGANSDGGDIVVITGENFGPSDGFDIEDGLLQWVRYGRGAHVYELPLSSKFIRHDGHTRIIARLLPGVGTGLAFSLSVADQESDPSEQSFDFAAPEVYAVLRCVGSTFQPEDNAQRVTIMGRNFGLLDRDGEVFVTFGSEHDGTLMESIPIATRSPSVPANGRIWPVDFDRTAAQRITFDLPMSLGADRAVRVTVQPKGRPSMSVSSMPMDGDTTATAGTSNDMIDGVACAADDAVSTWTMPSDSADYSSVFSYLDPVVNILALDPVRGDNVEETNKAAAYFLADQAKARILRISGSNFGPSQGTDAVERIVQVRDASKFELGFTTSGVVVDSWSDSEIVCYTIVGEGELRVVVRSKSWDGQTVEQFSESTYFQDVSPSISGAEGVAGGYPTHGWTEEHNNAYIRLPVLYLGKAKKVSVTMGDVECTLVTWKEDDEDYDRDPIVMDGALDGNGHTPFQALVLRPQAQAELAARGESGASDADAFYTLQDLDSTYEWDIWVRLPEGPTGSNQNTGASMQVTITKDDDTTDATPVTIGYDAPVIRKIKIWEDKDVNPTLVDPDREYCWREAGGSKGASLTWCSSGKEVDRVMVPTRGAIVRVEGENFGVCPVLRASNGRTYSIGPTATCGDLFYVGPPGGIPSRSHEHVTFEVNPGEGNGLDPFFGMADGFVLDIDVGGQTNDLPKKASLPPIGFSYDPATITSVEAKDTGDAEISTMGGKLVLRGRNFGAAASPDYMSPPAWGMPGPSFSVMIGRTTDFTSDSELSDVAGPGMVECINITRKSHEEMECILQEGAGVHLDAVAVIAGVESNWARDVFSYSRPMISNLMIEAGADDLAYETRSLMDVGSRRRLAPGDVQVARAATVGGYMVTLTGSNFGSMDPAHRCVFVAWPNRPATGSGPTLQRNLRRQLMCDGKETVHGEGEIHAAQVYSWTHTKIEFMMPPGVGMRDVTVRVQGQGPMPRTGYTRFEGSQADLEGAAFWYASPVVEYFGEEPDYNGALSDTYDIPTEGGVKVMVMGRNFGWKTIRDEFGLNQLQGLFALDGVDLPLHANDGSGSIDSGAFGEGRLPYAATMVNFYRSCMSNTVDLDESYILNERSPFIEGEERPECLDRYEWSDSVWEYTIDLHNDTHIIFYAPEGLGVNREVYVSHVEQDASKTSGMGYYEIQSNMMYANYSKPFITGAIPQRIDIREKSERHALTIKGDNFGPTGSTEGWSVEEREAFIYINDRECSHPDVLEGAKRSVIEVNSVSGPARGLVTRAVLECMMEYDVVGNKNVSVKVAGQSGHLIMTDPPTLHIVCDVGYYGKDGELCLPCPDGAECDGYDAILDSQDEDPHTYPRPLPEWYNLNSSDAFTKKMLSACPEGHQAQSPKSDLAPANMRDSCVVPCQPSYACVGNNYCARGYKSEAPMYRCSSCDDGFYRRAGECVKCPDNPWLLIAVFIIMGMTAAGVGYYLNRSKINIALIAIGVDYFQVLAIFAMSRVSWPPMIKELFHILSAFNLNIEITAPECSIPDIDYKTKWAVIMLLPIMAATLVMITYVVLRLSRLGRALRKWQHEEQWGVMVAGLIVIMYFLYLYVTRNVLDIFNCVPTDPPDGNLYLQPVFEECGKPGGIQMTLMPFAVIALLVYVIGFPTFVGYMIHTYGDTIRRDQLIRAMGFLRDFTYSESYPQTIKDCYQFRAKFSRLYYYFKPDYYYWILTIIGRKFFIAFCSLMFNTNPAFQLAAINLVIFISYTLQVRHSPYMAPQSYDVVLREWRLKVQKKQEEMEAAAKAKEAVAAGKEVAAGADAEVEKGKHFQLWEDVKYMLRYKERRTRAHNNSISNTSLFKADRTQLLGLLALSAFDYNTVETVLLFCAIVVTLGGIMFESGQFDSATYQETRDAVTVILMILIILSIIYFFTVLFTELHTMMTQEQRKKRLEQQKTLRTKDGGAAAPKVLDLDVGDVTMEQNRFVQASAAEKTDEVAGMELDAILAMDSVDPSEWREVKQKIRDLNSRFTSMQEATRAAKLESLGGFSGSGSAGGSTSIEGGPIANPLLAATARAGARGFKPTRIGSPSAGAGSRKTSRRGLLRKSSVGSDSST